MVVPYGVKQRFVARPVSAPLVRLSTSNLRVAGPGYDPCFMPLGRGRLCMLPGDHPSAVTCLPAPATYPPTVTVAVDR